MKARERQQEVRPCVDSIVPCDSYPESNFLFFVAKAGIVKRDAGGLGCLAKRSLFSAVDNKFESRGATSSISKAWSNNLQFAERNGTFSKGNVSRVLLNIVIKGNQRSMVILIFRSIETASSCSGIPASKFRKVNGPFFNCTPK